VTDAQVRLVGVADDHERLSATLARAFQNEEACSFIFPDHEVRARRLLKMFRVIVGSDAANGLLFQTAGGEAATLWRAPGKAIGSSGEFLASLLPFLLALGSAIGRGLKVSGLIERHHPNMPFWYLHFAGCDPVHQGKGLGGAAIRAGLARADADHLPAYLETATVRNLALYRSLGFEVSSQWQVPNGPQFWGMLRAPR
jgi:ribosomal protein S18 acetylase RimI-like enzyme